MYQFYYASETEDLHKVEYKDNIRDKMNIAAIRPTMWEEHCLECSAPLCYKNCLHYAARVDGRCKRFENGLRVFANENACCGQGVHIKFRKWANMMTIIFPAMLLEEEYKNMFLRNQKLGNFLHHIAYGNAPVKMRWGIIRVIEFLRRKRLRSLDGDCTPDAFVFHGYSHQKHSYQLCMEVYDDHTALYKTSFTIQPGENLYILNKNELSKECWKAGNLVKIYPENDLGAELDVLWCDFVKGTLTVNETPAKTVKCVVWDLDNTLWEGTLVETEENSQLKLRPGVLELIKGLDERGIVQSIASKNNYDEAWSVIKQLGLDEYFLYPQIHWNAKSASVEEIAKNLNIGIDALSLIDDSMFERNQVQSVWKQVRVYDAEEVKEILDYPEFQVMITEESRNRRRMYQAEEKRKQLRIFNNDDTVAFLKRCNLKLTIFEPKSETEKLRCYELVVRTNQLNMSGKKYTEEEFERVLMRPEHKNFAFSCRDDFGEYGIVGFGQYCVENHTLIFSEFAMSCRVAAKYVESALFAELLNCEQCEKGFFEVQKTKKNMLLRQSLQKIGFEEKESDDSKVKYVFTTELVHKDLIILQEKKREENT